MENFYENLKIFLISILIAGWGVDCSISFANFPDWGGRSPHWSRFWYYPIYVYKHEFLNIESFTFYSPLRVVQCLARAHWARYLFLNGAMLQIFWMIILYFSYDLITKTFAMMFYFKFWLKFFKYIFMHLFTLEHISACYFLNLRLAAEGVLSVLVRDIGRLEGESKTWTIQY